MDVVQSYYIAGSIIGEHLHVHTLVYPVRISIPTFSK